MEPQRLNDMQTENCSPHPLLDARKDSCAWKEDEDGMANTECGEIYIYEEGWEDHVRYCQGCGGVVWISLTQPLTRPRRERGNLSTKLKPMP